MTLELQINEATKAFLPEGALEFATPLQRVELKPSHGDESKVIIGQLVPRALNREPFKHQYILIFRMEFNEKDTNFFVSRTYKVDRRPFLTLEEACALPLAEEFSDILTNKVSGYLRPWIPPTSDSLRILFEEKMRGRIYRRNNSERINFRWPCPHVDSLLNLSNQEFHQMALALYTDEQSELRFSLKWTGFTSQERDEIAFECKNGSWQELRQIAKWVFQLWLGKKTTLPDDEFTWRFTSYGATPVHSENEDWRVWTDDFLRHWRIVLAQNFKPEYIYSAGVKERIPRCIDDYINGNELDLIVSSKPTQHEILEAEFQLSRWASEHLPAGEANRLLDL